MSMPKTFTATLAPRQSAALWLTTAAVAAIAAASFAALAASAESLVVWCRDFVVAASAGRGAAAVAVTACLGAVALVAAANVASFLIREAISAVKLARTTASRAVAMPGRVSATVASMGIRETCTVVEDATPFAVTAGVVSPRIIISTGLIAALTLAELGAVLAHEAHHCRARHPLRAVAWESFRRAFFFLPLLADVSRHFSLARELAADRAAVDACRGTRPLASALLKAVSSPHEGLPVGTAAFGQLQPRIGALRGDGGTELRVSVKGAMATAAFVAALVGAYLSLGSAPAMAAEDAAETQCKDAVERHMMESFDLTPYFSILVPQMSRVPPVQSVEIRS